MTQDNKIWHKPNEKIPTDCRTVVFIVPNASPCVGSRWIFADVFKDFHTDAEYASNVVNQWAYLDDLVASSKALDVAIDALKRLRDVPDEDSDQWFNYCCPRCVLQEISEIMKGEK